MAKLAEVQNMEGGTFFIGNADVLGVSTNFQPQHVLLPGMWTQKNLKFQNFTQELLKFGNLSRCCDFLKSLRLQIQKLIFFENLFVCVYFWREF